jgi:hypothetical protein
MLPVSLEHMDEALNHVLERIEEILQMILDKFPLQKEKW